MNPVIILGAGGHAKVVVDILVSSRAELLGFLDDNPTIWNTKVLGFPVLGKISDSSNHESSRLIVGIGDNLRRREIVERLGAFADGRWQSAIHPSAVVAASAHIGVGSVVMAGAVINPDAVIGNHAIINTGATVDHDCQIGDYVHVAPGVHLAGGVLVGENTLIGIGAAVIPYRSIGASAVIGAGAVVVDDIPDRVTAMGVPARWRSN